MATVIHVPGNINIVHLDINAVAIETHAHSVPEVPTIKITDVEGMLFLSDGERSTPEADALLVASIIMLLFLAAYL